MCTLVHGALQSILQLIRTHTRTRSTHALQLCTFPVAQLVEHGVSNAKIMGSIPRESKSW